MSTHDPLFVSYWPLQHDCVQSNSSPSVFVFINRYDLYVPSVTTAAFIALIKQLVSAVK